ncbi:Imm1 family immunity protein [Kribbella swartbergensis]
MSTVLKGTYDYETVQVTSETELTALLDHVASLARPTWLELVSPDHDALLIGLGREFSSLRFIEGSDDGDVYHSVGTLESPQESEFDFGTVPTTMDTGSAVSVTEARAAAAEFQRTGQRPSGVEWKVVEVPTMVDTEPFRWDEWSDDPEDSPSNDAESNKSRQS